MRFPYLSFKNQSEWYCFNQQKYTGLSATWFFLGVAVQDPGSCTSVATRYMRNGEAIPFDFKESRTFSSPLVRTKLCQFFASESRFPSDGGFWNQASCLI